MTNVECLMNDEARMTKRECRPTALVPRLYLGTHDQRGSASRKCRLMVKGNSRVRSAGGACQEVRSQAEPGNEVSRRDLNSASLGQAAPSFLPSVAGRAAEGRGSCRSS